LGVLQVALTEKGVHGLRKSAGRESEWIDRQELLRLEPTLGHALGAVLNPDDGAVDNVVLLAALEDIARKNEKITQVRATVSSVSATTGSVSVRLESGETSSAGWVVIAPGAWGGQIAGADVLSAVTPSRGQLVSYDAIGLRHVTYGPRGYLVPRTGGTCIAGSTMENAGFVSETTPEGLARVRSAAEEIAPALAITNINAAWAGLRPVTPDMLPILGADPSRPRIIYACGHSRNGILLAPLTGETVAALVSEETSPYDLSPFRPERFRE
jgi:glycine/D-amino acid oxidase-like deaminating enzyme